MSTHKPYTIAIASAKGGVGKSTIAAQLAMLLAKQGRKVGLIDADLYGPSQPCLFGLTGKQLKVNEKGDITPLHAHGVALVSLGFLLTDPHKALLWRAPMATRMIHQLLTHVIWPPDLDDLLIDLPPGTGDIQLSLCQKVALDGALVVSTPQQLTLTIVDKGFQMLQKARVPMLGLVENMSHYPCADCGAINRLSGQANDAETLASRYQTRLIARIPFDPVLMQRCDQGLPLSETTSPSIAYEPYAILAAAVQKASKRQAKSLQPTYQLKEGRKHLYLRWGPPLHQQQQIRASALRNACSCAACVALKQKGETSFSVDSALHITRIEPVGHYALRIAFSDTHEGLYLFERLQNFGALTGEA